MGYDRKVICDALHVDKTLISRMLSVADRIPAALIQAIGAAPSVGRDRWLKLADLLTAGQEQAAIAAAQGDTSDDRFEAVLVALTPRKPPAPRQDQPLLGGPTEGRSVRSGAAAARRC
ncbi:plasmid partitioning protein RepB C-terminal domain-containing protein [Jhaorihella thermophila]